MYFCNMEMRNFVIIFHWTKKEYEFEQQNFPFKANDKKNNCYWNLQLNPTLLKNLRLLHICPLLLADIMKKIILLKVMEPFQWLLQIPGIVYLIT